MRLGFASLLLVIACGFNAYADGPASPLRPEDEVKSFRLADDQLEMTLVAAEPDVVSPVAIAWDEDGRLFVAEMADYPIETTGGRIKLLEDRDHDGRFEKVTLFADNLPFPNGVLPWNGGILVTAAPDIWYLKDTDGDGRADERRVVLTGFSEGNQQLRANGLYWGLDNWIYGANGRSGGNLRRPETSADKAISIRLHDFRFRPDTDDIEAIAGFSQFGLAHDNWGNRFPSWNTVPMRHVVLEERYLSRNPGLAQTASVASILDPADTGRVYSISPPPTTFNREPVDYFNASCGLTIYRDKSLGAKYSGNAFVCESLTNLVHRRVLTPAGPTFVAKRGEQNCEFLASTDPWFHPVNLANGPDGSLYVVDFYRQSVEHPQFVPAATRAQVDFRKGNQHGRLWRIGRRGEDPTRPPQLGKASTAELVQALAHSNSWVRDTAQRMLVRRNDTAATEFLTQVATQSQSSLARVHALWTLAGLQQLDEKSLVTALRDPNAEVRVQSLRLVEGRVAQSKELQNEVLALSNDPDVSVRFQCALALGQVSRPDVVQAFIQIARRDERDEWSRLAILSSLSECAVPFLRDFVRQYPEWLSEPTADQVQFLSAMAAVIGAQDHDVNVGNLLEVLSATTPHVAPGQLALLAGLAEGMSRQGKSLRAFLVRPQQASSFAVIQRLLVDARSIAVSPEESPSHRVLALRVLVEVDPDVAAPVVLDLLKPTEPTLVQTAAARGLSRIGTQELTSRALENWLTYTTSTRRELLASLVRTVEQASAIIGAIEQQKIGTAEFDDNAREALRRIRDPELQKRIQVLFPANQVNDRNEVVDRYQTALSLSGDGIRGAGLFTKVCLTCHQMRGEGKRVGPDLSGIRSRPKAALVSDILDPNKDVAPDYRSFVLLTTRGQVLSGLLVAETPTSVTLRRAEGIEETILRAEIEELRASGKTLMPEGLERALSPQDLADVLAFLHSTLPVNAMP